LIRSKFRKLGLLRLQKSVFINPHPCEDAIFYIRDYYELEPGELYIFESKVLEGEEKLISFFNL